MTLLAIFIIYAIGLSAALGLAGHRAVAAPRAPAAEQVARRVLIFGATGGTGRQLVAQALERGQTVTAFVRDPAKLALEHPRLAIAQGDVLDASAVDAAMRGQDAVLSALGHRRYFVPTRILSEGTRNVIGAMRAHGVSRFVCETSLGIGDSAGRMGLYYTFFVIPLILPLYFWDKTRQERLLAASELDWTIVRPVALTNGPRRGSVRHGRVGSYLTTVRISRADVAAFMLSELDASAYVCTAVGIRG